MGIRTSGDCFYSRLSGVLCHAFSPNRRKALPFFPSVLNCSVILLHYTGFFFVVLVCFELDGRW